MTYLDKQEFLAWAYDDLLTNTTRGVLAEYIVAKALGIRDTKRIEWDKHDLDIDGVGVEVRSAAYVQTWKQTRLSEIAFNIRPAKGWDARTNTYAASAKRSADVYVFCLLEGEDREHIDPLVVAQGKFYVLSTSELDRQVPEQKTIQLGPLKALGAHPPAHTTSSRLPLMRQQRSIAAADEFLVEFPFAMVAAGPVRAVVRRR